MLLKINLFGLLLVLFSCATPNYTLIHDDDLRKAFILNSSPTFKGYFYDGSDSLYHYFTSKWEYQKDKHFKIQRKKLEVIKPFPFTANSAKQRVDLFDSSKIEFGKNGNFILYIVK